jgi:glycosyltransferase involved in cell wall biosynthesis
MKRIIPNQSPEHLSKITIVTIVFNGENYIGKTIQSVIEQDYLNIEYIVVDGNSTDKTKEIINKYLDKISIFISEPDQGIYDAMNKGANLAMGDWIIYMNAGDTFYEPSSISKISNLFNTDADVICAGTEKILIDQLQTRHFQVYPGTIDQLWRQMPTCHQAIVVRTACQKKYQFDTSYQWCGDHEMLARMYLDKKKFTMTNTLFCYFDCSGGQARSPLIYIKERWRLSRNLVPFRQRILYYGYEYFNYLVLGRIIALIKFFIPDSVILKLRKMRHTDGVTY